MITINYRSITTIMRIKKYQKIIYLDLLEKYLDNNLTLDYPLKVEEVDWFDFLKAVRLLTNLYIDKFSLMNDSREVYLFELNENTEFEVIKNIESTTHPWIQRTISIGEKFYYTKNNMYGSINREKGLPLIVDDAILQINYEYVDRIKN